MMQKVAIMTCFSEFMPGYSLTGIVTDQWRMLKEHGHEVDVFVNENFTDKTHKIPEGMSIKKLVPFAHLKDYGSVNQLIPEHNTVVAKTTDMLRRELPNYQIVFTHDWIFTGWNLPYCLGMKAAIPEFPNVKFFHWVHSTPSGAKDWWYIRDFGTNSKIAWPTDINRTFVAERYNGWNSDVKVIPHIKDIRTYARLSDETCSILSKYPNLMRADIVQLLPASVDRLEAKRLDMVIKIFAGFKNAGKNVCLFVAAQWATGKDQLEVVEKYRKMATDVGLEDKKNIIFSSDIDKKYRVGLPHHMIYELFLISNLFIFPTREESFGLVVPEAALTGNFLVLNRNLYNQIEITAHNALYFEFGSHEVNFTASDAYYNEVSKVIMARIRDNEMFKTQTYCRQRYNYDYLYATVYAPLMSEAQHKK